MLALEVPWAVAGVGSSVAVNWRERPVALWADVRRSRREAQPAARSPLEAQGWCEGLDRATAAAVESDRWVVEPLRSELGILGAIRASGRTISLRTRKPGSRAADGLSRR